LTFTLFSQVKAVLFTIETGGAAISLQGVFAKRFFQHLHPQHNPPHNLMYMRMVRLLELAFLREYRRLIDDNVLWLGSNFASTNSDFYRNPERRESYGCIVATMAALRYTFNDGRKIFVSKQTLNEGVSNLLSGPTGVLAQLETVNSFKRFDGSHTGKAVGTWLANEHEAKGLLPQYVGYHCTDGASNAVASVSEYVLMTEMNRSSTITHNKCLAHQTNRSAKYASGTGDFRENSNPRLSQVLGKAHEIIARVHRSQARLSVVKDIQIAAKRVRVLLPSPGVPTRWDSSNREVASLNKIMGDFNKALHALINGIDSSKLIRREGAPLVGVSDFTFTATDKLVLRQFECGSNPCVQLSKFYQLSKATAHETLFVTAAYISYMRQSSFLMYDDLSHTELADLRHRKRTIYVVSSQHVESQEDMGRAEQAMDPCIELFRMLYATDMEERCGFIDKDGEAVMKLPTDLAIACLLNPLYGGRRVITASGLMTEEQYLHAEDDIIVRLQLMMERENGHVEPIIISGGEDDSMDDDLQRAVSSERDKAKAEFNSYCLIKKRRYAPRSFEGYTVNLGQICMGKVATRGHDITASHPFVNCNLADFICDNGHFDLVSFLQLQRHAYPTLYKLAVCLSSIRTNEVGCERFFSTAGYVSCPRRTSLKVRNYECLATLKVNMQHVFIDERWVVNQYLMMEQTKAWKQLDTDDDMNVLRLEREMLAATMGVDTDSLPPLSDSDHVIDTDVVEIVDVLTT
jgi:hAT family C-terminal dimerisation region